VLANPARSILCALVAMAGVAVAVGCVESLVARMRLHSVPGYLMLASLTAAACLGVAGWLSRVP
ncbi:MAG: hypothetical protein ABL982_25235, partial [Vicinamibacterales bacterium]